MKEEKRIHQHEIRCPNCKSDNFDFEDEERLSLEDEISEIRYLCLKCNVIFAITRVTEYLNDAEIIEAYLIK